MIAPRCAARTVCFACFRLPIPSGYAETFPRNFLAPDGRVFGFDNSRPDVLRGTQRHRHDHPTARPNRIGGQLPGATSWTSSAAMFRPGRILQMGGASSAALVIDINGAAPVVTSTQSMSSQRQWVSATVLPDGRVLATGGSAVDNALTNVNNNSAEVWDPNGNGGTGKWTLGTFGRQCAPVSLRRTAPARCARHDRRWRSTRTSRQQEHRDVHAFVPARFEHATWTHAAAEYRLPS